MRTIPIDVHGHQLIGVDACARCIIEPEHMNNIDADIHATMHVHKYTRNRICRIAKLIVTRVPTDVNTRARAGIDSHGHT